MAMTATEVTRDRAEKARDQRSQSRFFQIIADNDSETAQTALSATGLPTINDAHPSDGFSVVDRVVVTRDARNKRVFDAEAIYTTEPGPEDPDNADNPLAEPAIEEWSTLYIQREILQDLTGKGISNSVSELYEGVTVDDPIEVLRITRNEATYSPSNIRQFRNKINLDIFRGASPGEARIHDISSRKIPWVQGGVTNFYWQVVYEIHFKPNVTLTTDIQNGVVIKGWQLRLVDAGFYRTDNGDFERIKDLEGNPVVSPVPLYGNGAPIGAPPPGYVFWNIFDIHASVNFSLLNL